MTTSPDDPIPPFTHFIHLQSIDAGRNRHRFYRLQWQPTLWGDRALLCIRGRVRTLGQVAVLCPDDRDGATAAARAVVRPRLRHGYVVTAWR